MDRTQFSATAGVFLMAFGGLALGQSTRRVSLNSHGEQAESASGYPSISSDGQWVVFSSPASNLVPNDTNGTFDVFVRDRVTGGTTRVSVSSTGVEGNASSSSGYANAISADGRYVVIYSLARTLVTGDTNGATDVFLHDRQTGQTTRISVDSNGVQSDEGSEGPVISADGRFVAFSSEGELVPSDTNDADDIYVHEIATGAKSRVSVDSAGNEVHGDSYSPSISPDGRYVAFQSEARDLVPGDTNGHQDIFLHDRVTGSTQLVSVGLGGAPADSYSATPVVSADGRFVAFVSDASNLVAVDVSGLSDVFVRDMILGQTTMVTVDNAGNQADVTTFYPPAISASGRFVAFNTRAILYPGDYNGSDDVYLRDLQTGFTSLVSVNAVGEVGNRFSYSVSMSADGRFVAFKSSSTNFAPDDTNDTGDVYVHDRGSPQAVVTCAGDGSLSACPCFNEGWFGQGCENSAERGGAVLEDLHAASLSSDTLLLVSSGQASGVTTVFFQGDLDHTPVASGAGLRCAGGNLKRLFVVNASPGGTAAAPGAGDPSISTRSAALGDPIATGMTRYYQALYRDPSATSCPPASGATWNLSNGLAVTWGN